MRPATWAMAVGVVIAGVSLPARGEVSRAEIEAAIERGVKLLVEAQAEDGHWPFYAYMTDVKGPEDAGRAVGHTALVVLALQHSNSKSAEAQLAIKKGLSYIAQHPPDPQTYTAGLVEQVFYMDGPTKNQRHVGAYAWLLCAGQKRDGPQVGSWTYLLPKMGPEWNGNAAGAFPAPPTGRSDNSNSQFGILGLVYAEKCGFQVPRAVWEGARAYYISAQHKDGGWDYLSDAYRVVGPEAPKNPPPTMTMTLAGTVSVYLCEEMLADKRHAQCKAPAPNPSYEAGLKWIGQTWFPAQMVPYGWYGCERLGILIGYSEFAGHDWYQEGCAELIPKLGDPYTNDFAGRIGCAAFSVLFLSRGHNPIIINKLKREGDWNLHRYDINNLIEHVSGPWQIPCQWRIVTLDAKVEFLLKVPIVWISGHEALKFTPEEEQKLKEYVERGGTILGEDCCSRKPFHDSFRALLKELWPENELTDLPKTHAIYTSFRKLENPPRLMALALDKGQGRLGVIYIPNGISCKWEVGGAGARSALDAGACIYLYVEKTGKKMKDEAPTAPEARAAPAAQAKLEKPLENSGQ